MSECQPESCGNNAHCVDDHNVEEAGAFGTAAAGVIFHCECDAGYDSLDNYPNNCDEKENLTCQDNNGG